MYKHLNRAKALQEEIARTRNALMQSRSINTQTTSIQTDPTAYRRLNTSMSPQYGGLRGNGKTISRTLPTDFKNPKAEMRSTTTVGSWQPQHWGAERPQNMNLMGMSDHLSPQLISHRRSFGSYRVPAYQTRPLPSTEMKATPQNMNQLNMAFQQKIQQKRQKGKNPCPYCEKVFQNNSRLERHIRSHTGERPFTCTLCGDRFKQKCHLTVHVRRHHFKCPICSLQFPHKSALIEHVSTHTDK